MDAKGWLAGFGAAAMLAAPAGAGAAAGALDTTYGTGGYVSITAGLEQAAGMAVATRRGGDGKLYTAQLDGDGVYDTVRVAARSAATGATDGTFAAGALTLRLRGDAMPIGIAASSAVSPVIHVGLLAEDLGVPMLAVARVGSTGVLDPTFGGGDGVAALAVPGLPRQRVFRDGGLGGMAGPLVLADGRVYVVASRLVGITPTTIVVRFTAAGAPDPTFGGGDGIVEIPGFAAGDLAVSAAGNLLYLAGSELYNSGRWSVVRLTAAGAFDPAFGGTGRVDRLVGTSGAATGILVAGANVTVAGTASVVGGNAAAIARWDLAGMPVGGFGTGGVAIGPAASGKFVGGFALAGFPSLYWVAESNGGFPASIVVERFSVGNGAYDAGFGAKTIALAGSAFVSDVLALPTIGGEPIISGASQATTSPNARTGVLVRLTGGGVPDAAFGTGGVASLSSGQVRSRILPTVSRVLPNGSAVLGGAVTDGGVERGLYARVTPGGLVDGGFGGGTIIAPQGTGQSYVFGLDVDASGAIGAVGRAQQGGNAITVRRLNANGTPLATFMPAIVTLSAPAQASGVLLDGAGLIVGGILEEPGFSKTVLTRVTGAGTVDATFATGGSTVLPIGTASGVAELVRLRDRRIVALLFVQQGSGRVGIARFTARGLLDTTFAGGAGYAVVAPPGVSLSARDIAITPDGGFVVLAFASTASSSGYAVMRFTAAGALDPTFGTGGFVTSLLPNGIGQTLRSAGGLDVAPDGRIVLTYRDSLNTALASRAVRLSARGVADPAFGGAAGVALSPRLFGDSDSVVFAPDGRILLSGGSGTGREYVVARLLSDRPKITSRKADRRRRTTARAAGRVTPFGGATTWWIEYGRTRKYGRTTSKKTIGPASAVTVRATLRRLKRNRLYHFRVVARNGSGLTKGRDRTFRTLR